MRQDSPLVPPDAYRSNLYTFVYFPELETIVIDLCIAGEPQYVGDVLGSTGGPLVHDEVISANERHDHTTQDDFDVPRPGSIEVHAGDLREQVDAIRRVPQLHDAIVGSQVVVLNANASEAKLIKGDQKPIGVGGVRPDPRIEVAGRPRQAVSRERIAAHDHVANVMPSE